ncbi:MAG: long-chain fatty acid--CoA ligase, partial [Planctomycetota bacterium]
LAELGVARGDRVGILSQTRPEWGLVDLAVLHLGAVSVGIYPTLLADEVAYLVDHASIEVLFVEDAEQLAKLDAADGLRGRLRQVVVLDGPCEGALSLAAIEARGQAAPDGAGRFEAAWRAVGPDDLATLIYTSGTTGRPKGAMLTHGNLCYVVHAGAEVLPHRPSDVSVAFLPMAHALQRAAFYGALLTGAVGYYAASTQTLMDDIREVEPTVQVSVPRLWEKLHARLEATVGTLPPRRRRIFAWGLAVGREAAPYRKRGVPLPLSLRARYALACRLVHDPLKRRVFGRRIRYLTSGGAPVDPEILEYFYALGLLVLEGWGLTETAAPATLNLPRSFKFGSVGKPLAGTEVRVAEDGELLVRGPGVFRGYYRDPEATEAAFTEDGFFRTGDIGTIDADGFVFVTDRKKNLIVLSNGKNIAPQKIENLLGSIPLVGNALVHGDRRNYLVALLTPDVEEAARWARARGLEASEDPASLAALPEFRAAIDAAVREKNAALPRFEQVKKWVLLGEVWNPEGGELTPTLKLKRRVIEERHRALLDGLYAG